MGLGFSSASAGELCSNQLIVNSKEELKKLVLKSYKKNISKKSSNRHVFNQRLNNCSPRENSKALVIAFEGTGAYEPLIPAIMNDVNKCLSRKSPIEVKKFVLRTIKNIIDENQSHEQKWSGLMSGPLSEIVKMNGGENIDWYSFPSEEVEQLAGLEMISQTSLSQLVEDIQHSVNSNPKGIQNARICIRKYLLKSITLGVQPKIVLMSHSSGGRSLVKFAEHIRKNLNIEVDLAFSIDPVIEAHHAIEEVVPQKIGEPLRYLRWRFTGGPYPYSAVWSRDHRSKLYMPSNVKKHLSFYQNKDRLGLKLGGDAMRFGIHGSRMYDADNTYIKGLGIDAHGAICYNKQVLSKFNNEIISILD